MTTRRMEADGLTEKTRVLDAKATGPGEVRWMREHAADLINAALAEAGLDERVDHRSFEVRGIDHEPTTHLGPTATDLEREGKSSRIGDPTVRPRSATASSTNWSRSDAAIEAEIVAEEERRLNERRAGRPGTDRPGRPRNPPMGGGLGERPLRRRRLHQTPMLRRRCRPAH